jgi:hypothetical protein
MNRVYPFLLSIAFVLSACSSEVSGFIEVPSVPPPPAIPPPPPPVGGTNELVVSTANSKPAARAAYGSTMANIDNGGVVGSGGIASSGTGNLQKAQIERTMTRLAERGALQVALDPIVQPCLLSGSVTITGDLASLPYTVGDTINVDATDCDDDLGEVINGRMEITISAYSGSILFGPTYSLGMDVLLINYEVTTLTDSDLSNGDSAITVDTTGDPLVSMSISGVSLTTVSNAGTEINSNFQTTQTVDISVAAGAEPFTLAASGTIDSTQLGGEISYSTPVTFQGAGAGYPFAGEMLITGANGATIRLIALTETTVRIEVDADGDGVVDVGGAEDTTWDDIAL